jgi:hypothetical protein
MIKHCKFKHVSTFLIIIVRIEELCANYEAHYEGVSKSFEPNIEQNELEQK